MGGVTEEKAVGFLVDATPTHFGASLNVPMPEGCDVIVVCSNNGYGLRPWRVLLPHQLYTEGVAKLMQERPDTKRITCIPASSDHYADVYRRP